MVTVHPHPPPRPERGSVYRGRRGPGPHPGPARPGAPGPGGGSDPLVLGAAIFLAVAVVVGVVFAWQGFGGDDAEAPTTAPTTTAPVRPAGPGNAAQPTPTRAGSDIPTGPTTVRSVSASLCLGPGDRAALVDCGDTSQARWTVEAAPDTPDLYLLTSTATDRCLDVNAGSRDDGAHILVYQCHRQQNQRWKIRRAADGNGFELVSATSDKCLDVPAENDDPGTQLQQWSCTGGANQRWTFNP